MSKKAKGYFHNLVTVAASLLVVAALLVVVWFFVFHESHEETNDAQVEQYVTPVMARITGYVQEVRYEENQFVRKGDTLIVIDSREYGAYHDQALADEFTAQNTVGSTKNAAVTTESMKEVEEAKLPGAKADLLKARLEFERYSALYKEEAATLQQLERVKADYDEARSHYQELEKAVQSARLAVKEAYSKLPVIQSQLLARKAVAEKSSLYLSYTVITAPYDGYVGKRVIQPGQMVKEGQTLVSVVSREKWVIANFKETQIEYLKEGQQVELDVDAFHDKVFKGVVQSLSPASGARFSLLPPDNATGNFVKIEQRIPVKIKLVGSENELSLLRAGMSIMVTAEHQN